MNITQIRNATQRITYAGTTFLIDPMLADQGTYPGFPGSAREYLNNPLVPLPLDIDAVLQGVEAVIVTHTHLDHWDDAAIEHIAKDMPVFVQNEHDRHILSQQGFTNLTLLSAATHFKGITLTRTEGQHGPNTAYTDASMAEQLGDACGIVFRHDEEGTLYLLGDTIWTPVVEGTLNVVQPDVVIANMGWAHIKPYGSIIMGAEDTLRIHGVTPQARIVATHMEAINHCLQTRDALRQYACDNAIESFVSIPEDGEMLTF